MAMDNEDMQCPIAQVAFGFEDAIPYYTEGNLAAGMYVETCGQGAITEEALPKFTRAEAGTVVVAPLHRCAFTPDLLLVYGNSAQVMRLTAAAIVVRTMQTGDRKSTRLNSSHVKISYAVFCLKKKRK